MLGSPTRDRTAERREATRQEILEAAWAVAHDRGLAQLTLREVAERVGMRAPSLYTHFASKNAIYDAMFAEAWTDAERIAERLELHQGVTPRAAVTLFTRTFFDFAVADLARHQLMNQRTIPGFEPSPEAYAPAVRVLDSFRLRMRSLGVTEAEDIDLCTAIVGGLADAQLANDPGGDRWGRLLDRAMEMYADNVGLPPDEPED